MDLTVDSSLHAQGQTCEPQQLYQSASLRILKI